MSANDHGVATRPLQPDTVVDGLGPHPGPAVTCATTEHFNLQTARALTVSEANGRASIYLAALSSNLIALASTRSRSRSPSARSSGLSPSRRTSATTDAHATPTAREPSIGPRS